MFGLPPSSPELKAITPYLQRADELKAKEPVMAYWCAYYAAQAGIALRARDSLSRTFLAALLTELEALKRSIGPNDAVDVESASSAYVENFALRVFTLADNEDRAARANRSTAKKFLAAANFLEVLKTFPKSELSESNEEKIRYAKWKAADIARAFREGRTPVPGPAAQPQPSPSALPTELEAPSDLPPPSTYAFEPVPGAPKTTPRVSPPPPTTSFAGKRVSPPPLDPADFARPNYPQTPPRAGERGRGRDEGDEGTWSTLATPGSAGPNSGTGTPAFGYVHPAQDDTPVRKGRGQSKLRRAWVGDDIQGQEDDPIQEAGLVGGNGNANAEALGIPRKAVHFTPSVTGGLSSTAGSPPVSPNARDTVFAPSPLVPPNASLSAGPSDPTLAPLPESSGSEGSGSGSPLQQRHPRILPSGSPPAISPPSRANPLISPPNSPPRPQNVQPAPAPPSFPLGVPPPPVVHPQHQPQVIPPVPPPPVPVIPNAPISPYQAPSAPAAPSFPPQPPHFSAPPPQEPYRAAPPPPSPPPELTPNIIAKAQKHCRFAISALDYEDAEQARRELRAALAVLGG